jgi:membrane-bound serine protease (ClpP class)
MMLTPTRPLSKPLVFCLLAFVCWLSPLIYTVRVPAQERPAEGPTAFVIPLHGTVDPGMAAFLKRILTDTKTEADDLMVFELDTFGGRVDSALKMVDLLINEPQVTTIAFVYKKAISAGALIALACNRLAMKPHTTIGDCAPISFTQEGPKMMGEKFQSPLRAQFRTLARRNGYPAALAESMVTESMEIVQIMLDGEMRFLETHEFDELGESDRKRVTLKKTVVPKGELLTMDDREAQELGFSSLSVESVPEMLSKMGYANRAVVRIEPNWSESFFRVIGAISPILMVIGLGAVYTEVKSPGFGAPGLIGSVCLFLVFLSHFQMGLANYMELMLVAAGVILLALEIFVIPDFGVAGIAGMVMIAIGLVLSMQDFVIPNPVMPWQKGLFMANVTKVSGALIAAMALALTLLRYVLPRFSKAHQGPYLMSDLKDSVVTSDEVVSLRVGDRGRAMSLLRPAGKMQIGNEVYDVVSQGEFIEKGSSLTILAIEGNRVIVCKDSET